MSDNEIERLATIESVIDTCDRLRANGDYVTTYRNDGEIYFTVIHGDDVYDDLTEDEIKEIF